MESLIVVAALTAGPLLAAPPPTAPPGGTSASGAANADAAVESQPAGAEAATRAAGQVETGQPGVETRSVDQLPAPNPAAAQDTAQTAREGAETAIGEEDIALRGPLHEAFARPVSLDPVDREGIAKQPPEPLDELPPEHRPDGDNVTWISGYWNYDPAEDDFLWISGLWRDVPPGRRWVPGYWSEVNGRYRWTAGVWTSTSQNTVAYLPQPPRSQERGPTSQAVSDDYFWVPGSWEYASNNYRWRPGYWAPHQQGWVWNPAYYEWSPNGYVYCDGYWDYALDRRGFIYAPVRYRGHRHGRYMPQTVLNIPNLLLYMFVNDGSGYYSYGDYYGRSGYRPWYTGYGSRRGYDPIYSYNQWRHGPEYGHRLAGWHDYFVSHADHRPRTTLSDQRAFLRQNSGLKVDAQIQVGRSVRDGIGDTLFGRRLLRVGGSERETFMENAGQLRSLANQRQDFETQGSRRRTADGNAPVEAAPLQLPKVAERIGIDRGNDRGGEQPDQVVPDLPDRLNDVTRPRRGQSGNAPGVQEGAGDVIRRGTDLLPGQGRRNDGEQRPAVPGRGKVAPETDGEVVPQVIPKADGDVVPKVIPKADGEVVPQVIPKAEGEGVPPVEPKVEDVPKVAPQADGEGVPKVVPEVVPKTEPPVVPKVDDVPNVIPKADNQGVPGVVPRADIPRTPGVTPQPDRGRTPRVIPRSDSERTPRVIPRSDNERTPRVIPRDDDRGTPRVTPKNDSRQKRGERRGGDRPLLEEVPGLQLP